MNRRVGAVVLGFLAFLAVLGGAQAVDDRDEGIVLSINSTTENSTANLTFRYAGITEEGSEVDANGFSRVRAQLCRPNSSIDTGYECFDAETVNGLDTGDGVVGERVWEDPDDEVAEVANFSGSASREDCSNGMDGTAFSCWTEVRLPEKEDGEGPLFIHYGAQVSKGSLSDDTFLHGQQGFDLEEGGNRFGTEDHSLGPLTETETNQFILWGVLFMLSAYYGWYMVVLSTTFGILGVLLESPPAVMNFKFVAVLTLLFMWTHYLASYFAGLQLSSLVGRGEE